MNIVICDDDNIYREKLEKIIYGILIEKQIKSEIILSTANPAEIIDYVDSSSVITLYLLDIYIDEQYSGIDLAQHIRQTDDTSPIIFITNYSDMLSTTYEFKLKLLDYIYKTDDEVARKKIEECILLISERENKGYTNCLKIKSPNSTEFIPFENIYFLETVAGTHKIILHHKNGIIQFYDSIKNLISMLNDDFVKCHKSVVVNKTKIIGVDKRNKQLLLHDQYKCSYSPTIFKW